MATAANWVETYPGSEVFYDTSSLKTYRDNGDVLYANGWIRFFTTEKYTNEQEKITAKALVQCASARSYKVSDQVTHDPDGRVKSSRSWDLARVAWNTVIPDTVADNFTKKLCRIAYERHLLPKKAAPKAPSQQRRSTSSGSYIDL